AQNGVGYRPRNGEGCYYSRGGMRGVPSRYRRPLNQGSSSTNANIPHKIPAARVERSHPTAKGFTMVTNEFKRTLWAAADKLRSSMDAAEYKHVVLGLIFLKYISDAFDEQRKRLQRDFAEPESELYLDDPEDRAIALEERDYYTMDNVFWVPEAARWENIRAQAKQPDIGARIDAAVEVSEAENPGLKGILDKRF